MNASIITEQYLGKFQYIGRSLNAVKKISINQYHCRFAGYEVILESDIPYHYSDTMVFAWFGDYMKQICIPETGVGGLLL